MRRRGGADEGLRKKGGEKGRSRWRVKKTPRYNTSKRPAKETVRKLDPVSELHESVQWQNYYKQIELTSREKDYITGGHCVKEEAKIRKQNSIYPTLSSIYSTILL